MVQLSGSANTTSTKYGATGPPEPVLKGHCCSAGVKHIFLIQNIHPSVSLFDCYRVKCVQDIFCIHSHVDGLTSTSVELVKGWRVKGIQHAGEVWLGYIAGG